MYIRENVICMININIACFRKNIFSLFKQTIRYNEQLNISSEESNAVVISEEDYRGIMETLDLLPNPAMKKILVEGKTTPLSDCIPENEVEW